MNMITALQNLYKAVSGEDNHKRNISKLLVDIHYAITGVESSVKNNWSRIIDSMATNWPEGGGGSSDFSTATMTVNYWEGGFSDLAGAFVTSNGTLTYADVPSGGTAELVLYKGKAMIYSQGNHPVLSTSGNIEYDSTNDLYVVTGDCSITLGDYE